MEGSTGSNAAKRNLMGSWRKEHRKYIERMSDVEENLKLVKDLLYTKFNKPKYDEFSAKVENLLIMENVIVKSNHLLDSALAKSKVSED